LSDGRSAALAQGGDRPAASRRPDRCASVGRGAAPDPRRRGGRSGRRSDFHGNPCRVGSYSGRARSPAHGGWARHRRARGGL